MTAWAVDTLIASSFLMAIVLLLRELVRRSFGASAAYALWLIPAVRMITPPITQNVDRAISAAVPGNALASLPAVTQLVVTARPYFLEPGQWHILLFVAWAVGAAIFFISNLARYCGQRRLALEGSVPLAVIGSIRLIKSEAVRGPIAFGILDRVIAVPSDFDLRFDERQQRLALEHELSHHRSGDLLVNLIAFFMLGFQWFNPLAWLSHAAFRFDQEASCDRRVLDKTGRDARADYGLAIAKAASGKARLFESALGNHYNLQWRLKSMTHNPTTSRRTTGKLFIIGSLLIALPLTATRAMDITNNRIVAMGGRQMPTKADQKTAKADLKVFERDQQTAAKDNETAIRDAATELRDSEVARRDSEISRLDSEAADHEAPASNHSE